MAIDETSVTEPVSPLLASEKRSLVKLFLSDVGLLTGSYVKQTAQDILDGARSANLGGIFENYAAQELLAHGFNLWYYSSKKVGELDAIVERADGTVLLFEIKSGATYKTHAALTNALARWGETRHQAFVLSTANIERDGSILYLPIYLLGLFSPDDNSL